MLVFTIFMMEFFAIQYHVSRIPFVRHSARSEKSKNFFFIASIVLSLLSTSTVCTINFHIWLLLLFLLLFDFHRNLFTGVCWNRRHFESIYGWLLRSKICAPKGWIFIEYSLYVFDSNDTQGINCEGTLVVVAIAVAGLFFSVVSISTKRAIPFTSYDIFFDTFQTTCNDAVI